jgi:CheY-like chemotaxis protein
VGETPSNSDASILIVDDEPAIRRALRRLLRGECDQFHEAACGEEALALARETAVSLAVLDYRMPGVSGDELLSRLREQGFTAPVILISAEMEPGLERTLRNLGASLCLSKAEMAGKLPAAVHELLAGRPTQALGSTA